MAVTIGVLVGATFSAVPASAASAAKSPINIAFLADLSGNPSVVPLQKATLSGINTAIYYVNASGGIDGHPLKLTTYDGQSTANANSVQFRQIIGTNATAVIGQMTSANIGPSIALIAASKLPFMYTGQLSPGVDAFPFMYGTTSSNKGGGKLLAGTLKGLLHGSLKGKVIAVARNAVSPAIDEKVAAIKAVVKAEGGRMGLIIGDPTTVTSWTSQAANIMVQRPDAVVVATTEGATLAVGQGLRIAGYKGVILADNTGNTDAVFSGINLANFYALRETRPFLIGSPLYLAVRNANASPARAVAAPAYFARGYDGMYVLAAALKKCGVPCSKAKLGPLIGSIGPVTVPMNPYLGNLDFRTSTSGVNFAQLWGYDLASKTAVPKGTTLVVK